MNHRHADAAWKVQERGAPSPRAYLRLVNAWMTRVRARLKALLDKHADADTTDDDAKQLDLFRRKLNQPGVIPPPPDEQDLAAVGWPAAKQSARAARQGLLFAGYPRVELEGRLRAAGPTLVGIDIAPTEADRLVLRGWAKDGTDLIRTVSQDLVTDLDEQIVKAAREGRTDLARVVEERLGVHQRHAQFIARDQIAKLNAAITQGTQRAAGVTHYKWRSSRDERTRPMHRELDGTIHAWDDPPVTDDKGRTNHPGEDFQCRCVSIGVVPDFSSDE